MKYDKQQIVQPADWPALASVPQQVVRVKRIDPNATIPTYATDGAACFDLRALGDGEIPPGDGLTFRTGLAFEIPPGYAMLIYSRSGHGFNYGVRLCNCVGVIDSDYRGEVLVRLTNDDPLPFIVKKGDRIAQAMLVRIPRVAFEVVDELSSTGRGAGGFGSTGA